ncbi:MAG: FIST C-terminal domain-containing protein [Chitinispirillia bacterium]|nr:FIST C-terminal domain-containing protein [Chitinispirillia bacterium]MCL2241663.1 FIST C-terminal domain-containing protein [Chitinispirillia bacterium]
MIKSYTVATTEIDDGDAAVREVTAQIASLALQKNTVGLVLAHPEFVSSGVYAQVAGAFPFPITGMTTISHCTSGAAETYMLSATVLTSDDCEFSCGLSGPIPKQDCVEDVSRSNYGNVRKNLAGEPKLAFIYAPFYNTPYLGSCIAAISAESGGKMPIFGAAANDDHSAGMTGARVLFNGAAYDDKFALLLVSGGISPAFYVVSATEDSMVMPRIGVITKAVNSRMMEINNVGAAKFLRNAGFPVDEPGNNSGLLSSIFVLHIDDGNGGVCVSRIPHGVTDDGGILCGGDMIEGAVLSIAFNTQDVVLETAKTAADKISGSHSGGTVIMHPCLGRRYGLLSEPMAELKLLRKLLGGKFTCAASYANGELCPTSVNGGKADNRFHNQTLVACVF